MPTLTYPQKSFAEGAPFVLFKAMKATYDNASSPPQDKTYGSRQEYMRAVDRQKAAEAAEKKTLKHSETDTMVAMYMPLNFSVGDSVVYDSVETGIIGSIVGSVVDESISQNMTDLYNNFSNIANPDTSAIATTYGPAATGATIAALGKRFGASGLASIIGGAAGIGAMQIAANEVRKQTQAVINPRQFMLFKSPNMRSFSMEFRFIPESAGESDSVISIIKHFRQAMYPELSDSGFTYTFPNAFQLEFVNIDGIPKLPELVLTAVNTTYNPNSMSYFKQNKRPVEINMSLQFSELQPMHKEMIAGGF
ncbi:MAG: hypothetical protein CBB72_011590 [Muricauda sp. TMED12]|nr:MAG: hypothetical protein CBB72_011590 [Muricauda sp. TMED12]